MDRLFDLLPPQDVGNPETFLAAAASLFDRYPGDLANDAAFEIAQRSDRPTLKLMREVLDEFAEKAMTRQNSEERKRQLPPPARAPRTPEEQARVDKMIVDARRQLGIPESGAVRREPTLPISADLPFDAPIATLRNDGNHARRVMQELDLRRVRREAQAETNLSKTG